jgi:non-heme chloroperoxidase
MPYITTSDGNEIFYTDQGEGRPVVFSHGWPLNSDAWQQEIKLVTDAGYRAIAHDRRGHGRSSQTWQGNDMAHYAQDLADVVDALDLHDVTVVGHSTGGGEVVAYAARHGQDRVAQIFTAGAVPPYMILDAGNPDGTPRDVFDANRAGVLGDRSQFYMDLAQPFYGGNRPGVELSQGMVLDFWRQSMLVNVAAAYDCIRAFSETDQTADLEALDVPIFIAHGGDDQIVPVKASAERSAKLVRNGTVKVYEGASHGIWGDYQKELHSDLLAFLQN